MVGHHWIRWGFGAARPKPLPEPVLTHMCRCAMLYGVTMHQWAHSHILYQNLTLCRKCILLKHNELHGNYLIYLSWAISCDEYIFVFYFHIYMLILVTWYFSRTLFLPVAVQFWNKLHTQYRKLLFPYISAVCQLHYDLYEWSFSQV